MNGEHDRIRRRMASTLVWFAVFSVLMGVHMASPEGLPATAFGAENGEAGMFRVLRDLFGFLNAVAVGYFGASYFMLSRRLKALDPVAPRSPEVQGRDATASMPRSAPSVRPSVFGKGQVFMYSSLDDARQLHGWSFGPPAGSFDRHPIPSFAVCGALRFMFDGISGAQSLAWPDDDDMVVMFGRLRFRPEKPPQSALPARGGDAMGPAGTPVSP